MGDKDIHVTGVHAKILIAIIPLYYPADTTLLKMHWRSDLCRAGWVDVRWFRN